MLQELLSEFQDTAPADIKLSSSPGETVLIQEIISPFPETPLSDTAHLHYRTDKPLPMTAAAADTGEDAVLSVQAGHEAGTPNTGIYPKAIRLTKHTALPEQSRFINRMPAGSRTRIQAIRPTEAAPMNLYPQSARTSRQKAGPANLKAGCRQVRTGNPSSGIIS